VEGFAAMKDGMAGALPVGEKFATIMGGLSGTQASLLASLERIGITIAASLAPVLQAIAPHIERAAVWFGEFAKNNTWLGPALAATAVALTTAGTALVAIGMVATALASVVTALGTLVGFAPMLPPIAAALVGIAAGLAVLKGLDMAGILDFGRVLTAAKETGDYLAGVFMPMLTTIKDAFTTAWAGISTAIQAGDWQAAGEIAMAGLEVAVAAGLLAMRTMWEDYRTGVLETILGTAEIAVQTLAKLSNLGGPFAGLLGGAMAGKASDILAKAGTDARQGGADRINAARQAQADAQQRLLGLRQRQNEFVEDINPDFVENFNEDFVEDIPQPGTGTAPDFTSEPTPVEMSEEDRAAIWDAPAEANRAGGSMGGNLTTYNAAAAQAAGFMGGGSPIEKMTTSVYQMAEDLKKLGVLSRETRVSNEYVVTMYERFLAAFQYA